MSDSTTLQVHPTNVEQGRAWDGGEGAYWAEHARRFDDALAHYHPVLMAQAGIGKTARVLDIGCGTGQTTRDAARTAHRGSALGVDLSARMLEVARETARREGLANTSFLQADAQSYAFVPESFDAAISRTGTMFFGDPVAAFGNIARALRAGAPLTMLVWQPLERNEWIRAIVTALAAGRDLPVPPPDQPGPFALSDPVRVRTLLTAAGLEEPELTALDGPMWFGDDAEDANRFVLGLQGWMLEDLDEATRARAQRALRDTLQAHETAAGVRFESAMWLVRTARRR
ncbi:MAG TPA: class I SAM-dependent methyltransferase [Nocardioidaceae bacterium]|jgi:SAM-dependent methyltransferase